VTGSVVNLLSYLADQLLRGCQSADYQVQALQIQLLRICLHYLISVDQQDLVLGGFLFLSFGPLANFSLFSYCFGFKKVFVCGYYYYVYPSPFETIREVIFIAVGFITLFYPLSLCDKKGE
jgi:hypothetical protein